MNHLDKIPAFYNPPEARGEDTFFSTLLDDAKVLRVPVYHFMMVFKIPRNNETKISSIIKKNKR